MGEDEAGDTDPALMFSLWVPIVGEPRMTVLEEPPERSVKERRLKDKARLR
jgi:hypothetical protein